MHMVGDPVLAGQYLRQDPDAAEVQVLTKACIWGNNLYQAGKGKVLEQARLGRLASGTHPLVALSENHPLAYDCVSPSRLGHSCFLMSAHHAWLDHC